LEASNDSRAIGEGSRPRLIYYRYEISVGASRTEIL
jgi:hypothetical protein